MSVVKPPVTYQRLPRVAATHERAATTTAATTAAATSRSARMLATNAPAVTLRARPTPRSRVISGVGRITSRHAAVAHPLCSRSSAKPIPVHSAPASPRRKPYSAIAARPGSDYAAVLSPAARASTSTATTRKKPPPPSPLRVRPRRRCHRRSSARHRPSARAASSTRTRPGRGQTTAPPPCTARTGRPQTAARTGTERLPAPDRARCRRRRPTPHTGPVARRARQQPPPAGCLERVPDRPSDSAG